MSSRAPSPIRLIARREFVERARDRSFHVSTAITLIVVVGLILGTSLLNRSTAYGLGVVGDPSRQVGREVATLARQQGFMVTLRAYPTSTAASQAVHAGAVDAALVEGRGIVVESAGPSRLVGLVQFVSSRDRARSALANAGLSPGAIDSALHPTPLPVRSLVPATPHRQTSSAIAFVGMLLLYGQLFGYGFWVASGVVEEKSSRVVELLLPAVRARQLLAGKVLGIGLLGLIQLVGIGAIAIATARLAGTLTFPAGALGAAGLVLVWFVVGFAFYSTLFATAGAIVSRHEELQNTMTPITLVILASFFVAVGALTSPGSTIVKIASYLPPSAPLAMPPRLLLGSASLPEALLSVAISFGATALLVRVAARVYEGALLRTGRVKLREVLRGQIV